MNPSVCSQFHRRFVLGLVQRVDEVLAGVDEVRVDGRGEHLVLQPVAVQLVVEGFHQAADSVLGGHVGAQSPQRKVCYERERERERGREREDESGRNFPGDLEVDFKKRSTYRLPTQRLQCDPFGLIPFRR